TSGRHIHIQGFMRAMGVVLKSPMIKFPLHLVCSPRQRLPEQLGFQGSMKTFFFSERFRVSWSTVTDQNANTHQPDAQCAESAIAAIPPRRTIVANNLVGQTILPKSINQVTLYFLTFLDQACFQHQTIPRMIVENGQWMTVTLRTRHVSFEIDLPKIIWIFPLKSLKRAMLCGFKFINQSIAPKDRSDRTCSWYCTISNVSQSAPDFPTTPTLMLGSNFDHRLFDSIGNSSWTSDRPARLIYKSTFPRQPITTDPLVPSLPANPKPQTQSRNVSFVLSEFYKFLPKRFHTSLFPGHRCLLATGAILTTIKSVNYVSEHL